MCHRQHDPSTVEVSISRCWTINLRAFVVAAPETFFFGKVSPNLRLRMRMEIQATCSLLFRLKKYPSAVGVDVLGRKRRDYCVRNVSLCKPSMWTLMAAIKAFRGATVSVGHTVRWSRDRCHHDELFPFRRTGLQQANTHQMKRVIKLQETMH